MPSAPIVSAKGLIKRYGDLEVVKGIDFEVPPARCTGLLGPNGAGKSTTMRMIMGLSTLTDGTLDVFGAPIQALSRDNKARIGLVPQESNLDPDISVVENLELYGRYFALALPTIRERVPRLLDFMQLTEKSDAPVNTLSGGMKRRLIIARALINDPELIILDEPTTGLDPQARVLIWKQLLDLKRQGRALLLTTHYMDEAQQLCDNIVVIDEGTILDEGTPQELIARHVKSHVIEVRKPHLAKSPPERWDQEDIGETVLYFVHQTDELIADLPSNAIYMQRQANLEDVFLRITGRTLREN
ncbi:MAG: ATP-binding cassette domain-containing protein [Alphaproteobacteria bacterium]|jgi:lipooligosaccharide transport system ATP-binding protein|nr:ATP-binding cassette domain-containing protein [Alphaproteobacteria bacterium]MBT4020319.1 ATP-binding cassette domain-containing protein [Alphaproteobacteria bacterium]MBT5161395.1 ATP-binding cassette domain-containing protein [Alphaproteobacteria bacterium]